MTALTRRSCFLALAIVVVGGASACGDRDDTAVAPDTTVPAPDSVGTDAAPPDNPTTVAPDDGTTQPDSGIIDVEVAPGSASDDFAGAASDAGGTECVEGDGGWEASGTVTNPTDEPVGYRIYVSFLDEESETAALIQTDVDELEPGASADWSATAPISAGEYTCVLRVERHAV